MPTPRHLVLPVALLSLGCLACVTSADDAATSVAADDRFSLERLLRYTLRPAFSQERLSLTDDGRVRYQLRRPWPNGATHLEMEPVAFLRRLALLIPRPRQQPERSGDSEHEVRERPQGAAV